jgi:four helix bundle protein
LDQFAFRRLVVYQKALDSVIAASAVASAIPREHMDLRWQLRRAARSVVLNIAEGAGEFSPKEKARLYRIARRSGWETVSAMDVGIREGFLEPSQITNAEHLLQDVAAMLTTMIKRAEARSQIKGRKARNEDA